MSLASSALVGSPRWTEEELRAASERSIGEFRRERMEEPLEAYLGAFEERQDAFETLLETTIDLAQLAENGVAVLSDPRLLEALRYIAGPPISLDDLKVVAEVSSIAPSTLEAKPDTVKRVIETIMLGLDRRRFPWVAEGREPEEAERRAAILASTALAASQRVATDRRNDSKSAQEAAIETALIETGFRKVPTRTVNTITDGPGPGEFCRETMFGTRKADILVGLPDRRQMPIEAKVSNSYTNSIKRLNNDAAIKAEVWRKDFGEVNVIPTAVLGGVYKLKHLMDAQQRGLTLFWAHDLAQMTTWIDKTRRRMQRSVVPASAGTP